MKSILSLMCAIGMSVVAFGQASQGISNTVDWRPTNADVERDQQTNRDERHFEAVSVPIDFNIPFTSDLSTTVSVSSDMPPAETETDNTPRYCSLLIAVSDYQHNDPELRNLKFPEADAQKLQSLLQEYYTFQSGYSTLLLNPTRNDILDKLEELAATIKPADNLLIYYAGHGIWDDKLSMGYWIPADGRSSNKSNWIANGTIRDYVAGMNNKHTLIISDACFSGSLLNFRGAHLTDVGMSSLYRLNSRKAMTSGTLTTVPDESKFMYYLLKRLAAFDGQFLSSKQLFYSIETAILNNSSTVPQFGVIPNTGDEGGDFIFIRK